MGKKMKAYKNKEEGKKEFYEHMKKAVISSLSHLKKKAEKEQINPLLDYDFRIDINKKSWDTTLKIRYPMASFVKMNLEEILKLPEVVSCMDFMVENGFHKMIEMEITDKNGKIVEDVETYKRFLGYEIVGTFLMRYVESMGGLDYNENTFNNLYAELEEYIYTEGREIIAIAPLLNFELKGIEKVDLGDFIIRRITEEEFKMLLSKGALGERHLLYPHGGIFETIWCIEKVKYPSKKGSGNLTPHVERVMTALRLFKRGSIYYSAILEYPKVWRTYWDVSSHGGGKVYGSRYELTDKDVENLKEFWNKFKSLNTQRLSSLDVAIRRFNFSYERRLPEDKLIDYITAFEALYLKGAREELGYRLALRCAYFLGKDEEERKRIFEILKGAYDVRSKIVHGRQIQSKSLNKIINKLNLKSLAELSMKVEEYLRESIKMFLDYLQSKSHEEIIEEIDEKIIAGC